MAGELIVIALGGNAIKQASLCKPYMREEK